MSLDSKVRAVEILRVTEPHPITLRMLSYRVGGIYTHYDGKLSHYCTGEDCRPVVHRFPITWRGYCHAQLWIAPKAAWQHVVLEVTEALELCFRGVYERGQIWDCWRELRGRRRKYKVQGRLVKAVDPDRLPADIDIAPILAAWYHVPLIVLDKPSPMPAPLLMPLEPADSADGLPNAEMAPPSPSDREEVRKLARQAAEAWRGRKRPGKGVPDEEGT